MKADLEFAIDIARRAGDITLKYFGTTLTEDRKADGSIVTVADRETERFLRSAIGERFPDDGILGEEFGEQSSRSNRRWIIDPIDGTFSFAHGVPLFGVLVALEIDSQAQIGVVHMPALGETIAAAAGLGCSWNGKLARVSSTAELRSALLVCGDFYECGKYGFAAAATRLQDRARERRGWGDCYGHILVATGRAEVALDPVMSIWDCAALLPILEEAGGTFTDWAGRRTIYGSNAISTNGATFNEVLETIRTAQ